MNEKGSATILALLVSAVMITVAIGFNGIVKEHLKAAEGLKAKAEAMVEARSTFDALVYSMVGGRLTQREILLYQGEKLLGIERLPLGGNGTRLASGVTVKIQDSSSLISLATPDVEALKRLVLLVGGNEVAANAFADSLLDWIDPDDLTHLNGAESFYYRIEGKPYSPRNFAVQYKDEVSFIRGMDPELYAKMEPYLTVLPSLGFNPNTADDLVLRAYLGIDQDNLENLKNYLGQSSVNSDRDMFALVGTVVKGDPMSVSYFPSPFLEVTLRVGSPRTIYTLNMGVDIRQRIPSPYSVLYWREG